MRVQCEEDKLELEEQMLLTRQNGRGQLGRFCPVVILDHTNLQSGKADTHTAEEAVTAALGAPFLHAPSTYPTVHN